MSHLSDDGLLMSLIGQRIKDCDILAGRVFIKEANMLLERKDYGRTKQFVSFCRSVIQSAKARPDQINMILKDLRLTAMATMAEQEKTNVESRLQRSWYLHALSFLEYKLNNLDKSIQATRRALANDFTLAYCDGIPIFSHSCFMLIGRYITLRYLMGNLFNHEALPSQALKALGLSSRQMINVNDGREILSAQQMATLMKRVLNSVLTPPALPSTKERYNIACFITRLMSDYPKFYNARSLSEYVRYVSSEWLSVESSRSILEMILGDPEISLSLWYIPLIHILDNRAKSRMEDFSSKDIVAHSLKTWIRDVPSYIVPSEIKWRSEYFQLVQMES